jgi:hypothetical protein
MTWCRWDEKALEKAVNEQNVEKVKGSEYFPK